MVSLRDAVRENHGLRQLVLFLAFAGCFSLWTDSSIREFAPIIAILLFLIIGETTIDAYDLPNGVIGIPIGLMFMIVPIAGFVTETAMSIYLVVSLSTITGCLGLWFVFDGIQQYRYRERDERSDSIEDFVTDDMSDMMLRFHIWGTVGRAVRDEPRTVSELAADLDLTESRVERALSILGEKDMVYRSGDTYHATRKMNDKLSPVKRFVRWVPRRLARPFRMSRVA